MRVCVCEFTYVRVSHMFGMSHSYCITGLISSMLQNDPNQRPAVQAILSLPFLKKHLAVPGTPRTEKTPRGGAGGGGGVRGPSTEVEETVGLNFVCACVCVCIYVCVCMYVCGPSTEVEEKVGLDVCVCVCVCVFVCVYSTDMFALDRSLSSFIVLLL